MKKKILYGALLGIVVLLSIYFYFAWQKQPDTASVKADFTVEAPLFLKEFDSDILAANTKYNNKMVEVTGTVSSTETADTTVNIKMADSATGSFIIFAFQEQHVPEAKILSPGMTATIRGSFSAGIKSELLGTTKIDFKRSTLIKH